ncbi:hypothetical protein [Mesorhizobium sp.]|uniref:hypothetical protein n=1 Tax=Mesorhizobium sp. TaxID=1871066 RepID=UPI0011F6B8A6|nr:hypothetical protein [Mesorhizobium sp.]TIP11330.1 MAG: hypothetical protein E5X73_17090 [Mesorhizobium sp.]
MTFEIEWHSQQGTRTANNRDHAGIGVRGDKLLAIVLDGSTRGPTSGQFAEKIARQMVNWFVASVDETTAETMAEQLRVAHAALAKDFQSVSASYALLYSEATRPVVVLHAGDCLVGRADNGQTTWLLQPHTLANALASVPIDILAREPSRHVLTRSFRSKHFMAPDLSFIELDDRPLLVATDGFWADIDADGQTAFVNGDRLPDGDEQDDRSVLSISRIKSDGGITVAGDQAAPNLYVRIA